MNIELRNSLVEAAIDVRALAYAKYSGFAVGAAILTASGEIFRGCNVENASYGLTQCAERAAVTSAIATGQREFIALAIAAPGACAPCGACRQVLSEFCRDLPIWLIDTDQQNQAHNVSLAQLFPSRFEFPA